MQEALSSLTTLQSGHTFVTAPVDSHRSMVANVHTEVRAALTDARERFRPHSEAELGLAKTISAHQETLAMHMNAAMQRAKELEQSGRSLLSPKRHGILAVRNYVEEKASAHWDSSLQTYLSYVLFAQAAIVIFFVFRRRAKVAVLPFANTPAAEAKIHIY